MLASDRAECNGRLAGLSQQARSSGRHCAVNNYKLRLETPYVREGRFDKLLSRREWKAEVHHLDRLLEGLRLDVMTKNLSHAYHKRRCHLRLVPRLKFFASAESPSSSFSNVNRHSLFAVADLVPKSVSTSW